MLKQSALYYRAVVRRRWFRFSAKCSPLRQVVFWRNRVVGPKNISEAHLANVQFDMIVRKPSFVCTIATAVLFLLLATPLLWVESNSLFSQEPSQQIDHKIIRETVEAVAAVIKAEYFDAVTAARTSDALHERLAQARYANARSLEHLAESLTRDLLHLTGDKHLMVTLTEDLATESLPTQKPSDESRKIVGQRANFGVQRVEILPGNIGYLNLTSLYRPDEAREAITAAFRLLQNSDAIILDLRNNGGGSPETAVLVLSYFFEKKGLPLFEIVSRSGSVRNYATDSYPSTNRYDKCPFFVLTSERTFSAGEGLAFVLQERGRARICGETTAGAANPGRPYPATTRVEVIVPNGKVRTAVTGRNWEGSGVVPDIKVAAKDALRHAHIQALRELQSKALNGAWKLRLKQELDAQESK